MILILKQTGGYGADRDKLKCEIQFDLSDFDEVEISEDTITTMLNGVKEDLTGYEECGPHGARHYPPNWVHKGKSYNRVILKNK